MSDFEVVSPDEIARLRRENDHMRATLAIRGGPCQYCALPLEEIGRCERGFPGCARADDAMMCPHFGAGVNEADLRREVAELRVLVAGREMSLRGLAAIVRRMEVRQGELLDESQWLRGALLELRSRLHSQGRRPQECYEMSLIDDALKPLDS